MNATISEFPKQPLPHLPNPPLTPSQPPTPVVYERVEWEYKVVKRKLADGPLSTEELNALGKQGWELTGVMPSGDVAQFYFKRVSA